MQTMCVFLGPVLSMPSNRVTLSGAAMVSEHSQLVQLSVNEPALLVNSVQIRNCCEDDRMTKWLGSVTWGLPLAIVVLQSGASAQDRVPARGVAGFHSHR